MALRELVPIPCLEEFRSFLFVQPHPDDNEFAAGGTVAKLAAAGARVGYLTVTDGAQGTLDPAVPPADMARTRRGEQEAAARGLGVGELFWLDLPDGEVQPTPALRHAMVRAIRRFRPECVVTCDPWLPYEAHPDHRYSGLAAAEAVAAADRPHLAAAPDLPPWRVQALALYWTRRPNTWVNVTDTWAAKLQALACHRSQFLPPQLDYDTVAAFLARQSGEWGGARGYARAEVFKVLGRLHLHCQPEAADC